MWQILLKTYKLLPIAWSWLGDLHCSFYFWWGDTFVITPENGKKKAASWQKEKLLLRV